MNNQNPSRSALALLAFGLAALLAHAALADATLDMAFGPKAVGSVYCLAPQPDGKTLVGVNGSLGDQVKGIRRLNEDGSLDADFNPGGSGETRALAVEGDYKVLVGGGLISFGGEPYRRIARLNADGSVESSFNPGSSGTVDTFVLPLDGKILVGGWFHSLGGQPCTNLGRLNLDGTLDQAWIMGKNDMVHTLALQPDGKVLVGGFFTTLAGHSRTNIGRLNPDGSVDLSFHADAGHTVVCMVLQRDGKILVGGRFGSLDGQPRECIGRLNSDGSLDTAFNPTANGEVNCIVLQADGKILVGGRFTQLGGHSVTNMGRLNVDGSLDTAFNPGPDGAVHSLALQADGKVLVGGRFQTLAGCARTNIGRLNNTEPATQELTLNGSKVTWLRGGTSPEVWSTTFEISTNGGAEWAFLGHGERIGGGWELRGVNPPPGSTIRARGHITGGYYNNSRWFCESVSGPLAILRQPLSRTKNAGTIVSFTVHGWDGGWEKTCYQWRKNGTNLVDEGNIYGVQTSALVITNLLGADGAGYSVVLSNHSGSVTSVVARLDVVDPFILKSPVALECQPGQSASLEVATQGTLPMTYQWRKDGVVVPGQTSNTLGFTNLSIRDAGYYSVLVTNEWGSAISTNVPVTVNSVTPDTNFNPEPGGPSTSSLRVSSLLVQPDGKIVIAGGFETLSGRSCTNIGRVHPDGSVDGFFNPGANQDVRCLALQSDGKILVAGDFSRLGGQSRNGLGTSLFGWYCRCRF